MLAGSVVSFYLLSYH